MKQKILLIDDDEEFLRVTEEALVSLHFSVQKARSFQEASTILQSDSLDLEAIICDVNMPDGSGVDLLRKLNARKEEFPLFVAATAYPSASVIKELVSEEADYVLVKPISKTTLQAGLERAKQSRQDRDFRRIMRGL
ncbi:MAG: response regulator [Proteobacteria bacterium]|nr:MAG: response regulator [Pseudomonadota bacterium]